MQCIETETVLKMKSASARNTRRKLPRGKSWNGVALLASAVGLGSLGGIAWLYFYAVSAVQSALSAFQP